MRIKNFFNFISQFDIVIIHKVINFITFSIFSFFIIYIIYYHLLLNHANNVATQKIKYGKYLLEKEFKRDINLLSYLASYKHKKQLKFLSFTHDSFYALIRLDKNGNIKKFYNIKGNIFDLDFKIIKNKLTFLKLYKKEIDSKNFYISPIYPNFLGYQNSFLVGFPYFKHGKQDGYLFAIFDTSINGLLKNTYFYLFSNIDKNLFIKYIIDYSYFDKLGIEGINLKYKIDTRALSIFVFYRTLYILLIIIAFYLIITFSDFIFAYKTLFRDAKMVLSFLEKGNFQCNTLNFSFSQEICKRISDIFSKLISKDREIDLLVDSLNLIIKENKDIKGMIKDISSLLKILIPCEEIYIGIFDLKKGMSIFSGSNVEVIKEELFEKVKKELEKQDVLQKEGKIYIKYTSYPFEIYYIFNKCAGNNDIKKIKDLLDIVNLIIITALKLYVNSIQDPLTGAFNREKMEYDLLESLEMYKRYKEPFSLIMLDIDHFKKINDTYGHDAGDMVLKALVRAIKGSLRKGDIIYRYGGEEFIILLPKTTLENAIKIAEKLREKISYVRVPYRNTTITFTASFGVTQVKDGDNIDTLIKRVDTALYKAKNNGRNRVEYAE